MVNRISLSRLIDYVLQPGKQERKENNEMKEREDIKVSLSKPVQILESKNIGKSDKQKIEEIKEQLKNGEYEVNEEKIKEGLERFFL